MTSEWPLRSLQSVCSKIGSGATPRGGSNVYIEAGTRLIRSQNVLDLRFTPNGLAHIDDTAAEQLKNVAVLPGDVLINITGDSVARVCRAPEDGVPARVNQHVAILRAVPSELDADFLTYWLASPSVKRSLLSLAGAGATRKALTKGMLEQLQIPLPSLSEQLQVVAVLTALDDKIESNRRVIEASMKVAGGLYEHAIGQPGRATARVEDLCTTIRNGSTPKRAEPSFWGTGVSWFKTGELTDGILPSRSAEQVTAAGIAGSSCAMFPAGTVLMAIYAAPTVGRLGILSHEASCNQACTALVPKPGVGTLFVFLALQALRVHFNNVATGSAQQNISKQVVADAPVVLPPPAALAEFVEASTPILRLVENTSSESRDLQCLRDTLLPKLISGKVRISESPAHPAPAGHRFEESAA